MELDEFKDLWQTKARASSLTDSYNDEHINQIIMDTNSKLSALHGTNIFWWKFSKISTVLLLGILALTVTLFVIDPEIHAQLSIALPFIGIVTLCAVVSLGLYYQQARIFDLDGAVNIKMAMESAIRRFKRFYFLFNVANLIMLPVGFYIAALLIEKGFLHIEFVVDQNKALQSAALTVVTLAASHWYYKRKYFARLGAIRSALDELDETDFDKEI